MTIVAIDKRTADKKRFTEARHNGASPLQADIIAKRIPVSDTKSSDILNSPLDKIDISNFKDIDKTSNRLVKALRRGEQIAILAEFNSTSLAAASIIDKSLVDFFDFDGSSVKTYIGSNLKSKQGITSALINRVFESDPQPTLVICIGMAAIDTNAVKLRLNGAKKNGTLLDFLWCGNSKTATERSKAFYAMINPQQDECESSDKEISDTALAVLLMSRLRKRLVDQKIIKNPPKMGQIIPLAACTHMQHTSSLLSPTNRSLARQAFSLMMNPRLEVWKAFRRKFMTPYQPITSHDISRYITETIEAHARRAGCPYDVIKFFRSDNELEALRYLNLMTVDTNTNGQLEKALLKTAMYNASRQVKKGNKSLFIYLKKATAELQLKIAQAVQGRYSMPTCIVAPDEYDLIPVKMEELQSLGVNPFTNMKPKENIQIKGSSKQLQLYLSTLPESIESQDDFMLVAKKGKKQAPPTFELYTLEPYAFVSELDYQTAAKISPKNIFQGIKRGAYKFTTKNGELVFDLEKIKEPKLYTKSATIGRAIALNFKELMASDALCNVESISNITASDEWVSFNIELEKIASAEEQLAKSWTNNITSNQTSIGIEIKSDGQINPQRALSFVLIDEIKQLEPYGKGFEYPLYEICALCYGFAQDGNNLRLKLQIDNIPCNAIWPDFFTSAWADDFEPNREYTLIIEPRDTYKDDKRFLLPHIIAVR